jgi:hypothetical protein
MRLEEGTMVCRVLPDTSASWEGRNAVHTPFAPPQRIVRGLGGTFVYATPQELDIRSSDEEA